MGVEVLDGFDTVSDCRHVTSGPHREPITIHSRGPATEQSHRPNDDIPDHYDHGESNLKNVVLLCH
jgi:hypothetical protein